MGDSSKLPRALLERLRKRGIIPRTENKKPSDQEPEEEVIAEDYDEPSVPKGFSGTGIFKEMVSGCPNKYNIYHDCSEYCQKQWGSGETDPSPSIQRKYTKLLKRYPLPGNWQQVWEPGVNRYYFWNTITDEVSWFPPSHPKAKVSLPAPKLRTRLKEEEKVLQSMDSGGEEENDEEMGDDGSLAGDSNESESDMSSYDSMESDEESRTHSSRKPSYALNRQTSPPPSSSNYSRRRNKNTKNDLDPMDPASYSDSCPRGKWSDGLETKAEAKSGVDSTVSGPMFQSRPYPSPGAVLRMNKK